MTHMRRIASFLMLFALLSGCGGESSPTGPDGPVGFTEVFRDKAGGIPNRSAQVISRQERWVELWDEITAGRTPKPAIPAVNFDQNILIVAALGETGDACRHIRVEQVVRRAGVLEVAIAETRTPPSCVCPPVTVRPVHVVAVPRLATGASYSWRSVVEGAPCN